MLSRSEFHGQANRRGEGGDSLAFLPFQPSAHGLATNGIQNLLLFND